MHSWSFLKLSFAEGARPAKDDPSQSCDYLLLLLSPELGMLLAHVSLPRLDVHYGFIAQITALMQRCNHNRNSN